MGNEVYKECKKHGLTKHLIHGKKEKKCYCAKCQTEAVNKRRKKIKIDAIEYKGGCCEICGYNKSIWALQFHHKDPNEKDFSLSSAKHNKSWDIIKQELDKCMLLCSNCHFEIHEKKHCGKDELVHTEVS